jgi:hypothetical protein
MSVAEFNRCLHSPRAYLDPMDAYHQSVIPHSASYHRHTVTCPGCELVMLWSFAVDSKKSPAQTVPFPLQVLNYKGATTTCLHLDCRTVFALPHAAGGNTPRHLLRTLRFVQCPNNAFHRALKKTSSKRSANGDDEEEEAEVEMNLKQKSLKKSEKRRKRQKL